MPTYSTTNNDILYFGTTPGAGNVDGTGDGDDLEIALPSALLAPFGVTHHRSGSDFILAGGGNNEISGDYNSLELSDWGMADIAGASHVAFGNDYIWGDLSATDYGDDRLIGDAQNVQVSSSDYNLIHPRVGNIYIDVEGGADTMLGQNGDDVLYGDYEFVQVFLDGDVQNINAVVATVSGGNDRLYGGGGEDFLIGDMQGINLNLSNATVKIGTGDDYLDGGDDGDVIYGDLGTSSNLAADQDPDWLFGSTGHIEHSEVIYWFGNDVLIGGDDDAADFLVGDVGNLSLITVSIPNYAVTVTASFGDDDLFGGAGDDTLYGDTTGFGHRNKPDPNDSSFEYNVWLGDDTLFGGAGDDVLVGDVDYLFGDHSYGDDVLFGGTGNDMLTGDSESSIGTIGGNDIFVFAPGDGIDTVTDFVQGQDRIDVSAYGVTSVEKIVMYYDGDALVLDLDGTGAEIDEVRLIDHFGTQLGDSDFIF